MGRKPDSNEEVIRKREEKRARQREQYRQNRSQRATGSPPDRGRPKDYKAHTWALFLEFFRETSGLSVPELEERLAKLTGLKIKPGSLRQPLRRAKTWRPRRGV